MSLAACGEPSYGLTRRLTGVSVDEALAHQALVAEALRRDDLAEFAGGVPAELSRLLDSL